LAEKNNFRQALLRALFLPRFVDIHFYGLMFDWQTFWLFHRRKGRTEKKPRFLGNLKGFARFLVASRPAKSPEAETGYSFVGLLPPLLLLVLLLVCWKFVDWLIPTHWFFSLMLAVLLVKFLHHFLVRLSR